MRIITFNSLKPLAFTALFIVFAASFNTAEAEKFHGCGGNPGCSYCQGPCYSDGDCPGYKDGVDCYNGTIFEWGIGKCDC